MMAHKPYFSTNILDSKGHQIPLALVTEWGSESLRVSCPYCLGCHHHGIGGTSLTRQTRVAHCGPDSGSYQLCYPFEEQCQGNYSYRIDKVRGLFMTVGIAEDEDEVEDSTDEDEDEDSTDEEGEEDHTKSKSEEAKEDRRDLQSLQAERGSNDHDQLQTLGNQVEQLGISDTEKLEPASVDKIFEELMQDACYRQDLFISHCILNDLHGVVFLLETYKDDPFISQRDEDGVNCIAWAAIEGHVKMVQLLYEKGGNLNNADCRGRTPLMEAALWGRLKVVNFLLEHGADPRAKDRRGWSAFFYSIPSRRTARLRHKFNRYQEGVEAEPDRRIIAVRLQAFEPVTAIEETASSGSSKELNSGHFVTKTTDWGTEIGFYEQSIAYNVPDIHKTIARLDRGRLFPVVSAASGWRTDFAVEHVLDNRLWRDRVLELCQLIGYVLPEHEWDEPTRPGSYHASHAEKKLVAYYINQHFILPSELFGSIAIDRLGEWIRQDLELQRLATLCPRIPTVRASVRVSRAVCSDCELFISRIKAKLGILFTIEHCEGG